MKNTLNTIYTISAVIAIIAITLLFTHDCPKEVKEWNTEKMVSNWMRDHSEIPADNLTTNFTK